MEYQTFEPNSDLSGMIKCYWALESPNADPPERQTIVPDGCMEMIFHYGDLYRQITGTDTSILQPRCFVFGQLTRPLEIEPTGSTGIFSVRFRPNGFYPFSSIPIKEMENRAVPLVELFGPAGQEIEHRILSAAAAPERIRWIEDFLTDRLSDTAVVDRIVESTIDTIMTANGQLSIEEISNQLRINRRQLERKFSSMIGLSPKQLSRTIRLQATLKMMLNNTLPNLTAVAHEGDFFDQAHFTKEFKELTGLTPKEFYGESVKMSTLFYTSE